MSDQPETVTFSGKLIIGLTGNIATGKTAVMRLAAAQGALTIDADAIVHQLMDHDPDIQAAIAVAFGSEVRREDGRINRQKLGEIVFNDPAALHDLEAMVHPAVRTIVAERIGDSSAPVVVIEAIKLLEGDLAQACHQIWVTRCARQRQLQRLMICRGLDAENAAMRIKAQPPQEEKVAVADVVIDTDGLMSETELQFDRAWSRLPNPETAAPKTLVIGETSVIPASSQPAAAPRDAEPARSGVKGAGAKASGPKTTAPRTLQEVLAAVTPPSAERDWPENLQVRRAKPSDIPSILLLIQKATDGRVTMKRADLLLAFSERSYVIGQIGANVCVVMGWSIDTQVARIDQIFILPAEENWAAAAAVLAAIEESAGAHIGELIAAFIPEDGPEGLGKFFAAEGYAAVDKKLLPDVWQTAVTESQPAGSELMIKVLRTERLRKS